VPNFVTPMSVYDKYLGREVVGRAWQQIQKSLISEDGRLRQLFSLKPIDLYDTNTTLTVNGANIKIDIKSYLENIIQKQAKKGNLLWPFSNWGTQESLNYKFNVVVNGKMDYPNIETWVRNTFNNRPYVFNKGRYILVLRDVISILEQSRKLQLKLDLQGSIRLWKFRFKTKSIITIMVDPVYDSKAYLVRMNDLDYNFETANILLKFLDKYYHEDFKQFLIAEIEISIKEDLFTARILAQEEMNKYQTDEKLMFNGYLNDLELERFEVQKKGIEAVFLAQGNIQLNR
jgi:hypothetical protein